MKQKVMMGSRQRQWSQENCSLGASKITLRFNDSLKRLTELSVTVTLMAIVYYSKQIQIIISDRVRHIRQSSGMSSQLSSPSGFV